MIKLHNKHLRTKSYSLDEMDIMLSEYQINRKSDKMLRSLQNNEFDNNQKTISNMNSNQFDEEDQDQLGNIQNWILNDQNKLKKEVIIDDINEQAASKQKCLYQNIFAFGKNKYDQGKEYIEQNDTIIETKLDLLATPKQKTNVSYQLIERSQYKSTLDTDESTQQKSYCKLLQQSKSGSNKKNNQLDKCLNQDSSKTNDTKNSKFILKNNIPIEAFKINQKNLKQISKFKQIILQKKNDKNKIKESSQSNSFYHMQKPDNQYSEVQQRQNMTQALKYHQSKSEQQQLSINDLLEQIKDLKQTVSDQNKENQNIDKKLQKQQFQFQSYKYQTDQKIDNLNEELRNNSKKLIQINQLLKNKDYQKESQPVNLNQIQFDKSNISDQIQSQRAQKAFYQYPIIKSVKSEVFCQNTLLRRQIIDEFIQKNTFKSLISDDQLS